MSNLETELLRAIRTWAEIDRLGKVEITSTLRRLADRLEEDERERPWEHAGEVDG